MQRYDCRLPYTTAFVECTQISRSLGCLNSKALEDTFSVRRNSELSAAHHYQPTLPVPLAGAGKYTSAGLRGTMRQGVTVTHVRTEFGFKLETFSLAYRENGPCHDSLT